MKCNEADSVQMIVCEAAPKVFMGFNTMLYGFVRRTSNVKKIRGQRTPDFCSPSEKEGKGEGARDTDTDLVSDANQSEDEASTTVVLLINYCKTMRETNGGCLVSLARVVYSSEEILAIILLALLYASSWSIFFS